MSEFDYDIRTEKTFVVTVTDGTDKKKFATSEDTIGRAAQEAEKIASVQFDGWQVCMVEATDLQYMERMI